MLYDIVLVSESWQEGSKAISVGSPLVDEERTKPGHRFGSVLFGQQLQVTVHPMLRDRCSVCDVGVLWPIGWMDQDATWYGGRPLPRQHFLDGNPVPPMERGTAAPSPLFGPCLLWLNGRPSQ